MFFFLTQSKNPKHQSGFTLIEVVLVTAISGLLLVIVFNGQYSLQTQASFDTSIERVVQSMDYARNFATSNVNLGGNGNDTGAVVAGAGLEFNNVHLTHNPPFPLMELEAIYDAPTSNGQIDPNTLTNCPPGKLSGGVCACPPAQHPDDQDECYEEFFHLGANLTLYNPTNPNITGELVHYINTSHGVLVCIANGINGAFTSIQTACATSLPASLNVYLKDNDGHTATIQVDPSTGYARRL